MSITPPLKASARSAYRDVWRAASVTFQGDASVLQAFRRKMRDDATAAAQDATDAATYGKYIQLSRDISSVLRRNVVQATKIRASENGEDTWKVRITKDTELGDNESIKSPEPVSNRSLRKREKSSQQSSIPGSLPPPLVLPVFYSSLKKAHLQRLLPELKEEDLEESFVRGSGPGGQSINKTENNVQLLHKPTKLRVSCQETRSLSQNRKIARKWLLEKLDKLMNPGLSKEQMKAAKQRERERRRRKKAKKKALVKGSESTNEPDVNSNEDLA